jgi:hypothetical protein
MQLLSPLYRKAQRFPREEIVCVKYFWLEEILRR